MGCWELRNPLSSIATTAYTSICPCALSMRQLTFARSHSVNENRERQHGPAGIPMGLRALIQL